MALNLRQRQGLLSKADVIDDVVAEKGRSNSALRADGVPRLLIWDKLAEWCKDNEFIHTGYRPISDSYIGSLRTCLYIHNEMGNIYRNLLATLWMLALPIYFYPYARDRYPNANADDWTVFGLYFLGGALCFGLSSVYHTFSNHSHAIHDVYHRLDLLGISTVTAGCFPPGMWYTFPCASREVKIFWVGVSANLILTSYPARSC